MLRWLAALWFPKWRDKLDFSYAAAAEAAGIKDGRPVAVRLTDGKREAWCWFAKDARNFNIHQWAAQNRLGSWRWRWDPMIQTTWKD